MATKKERTPEEQAKLRAQKTHEADLWKKWDSGGRNPNDLVPLLKSLEPVIQKQVGSFSKSTPGIASGAIDQQVRLQVMRGVKTYDPSKGQLVTHIYHQFPRVNEFVAKTRNFGRISRPRFQKWNEFQNALNEFKEIHGAEPTVEQLQERLQWPNRADVERMMVETRKEVAAAEFLGTDPNDINAPSHYYTMMSANYGMLKPEEQKVFSALFPHDRPVSDDKLDIKAVAKELNMRPDKVYRIRERIHKKMKPYLTANPATPKVPKPRKKRRT